jgi:hypothetical protein
MTLIISNPTGSARLSKPRTTQDQRTRAAAIDRLRGCILARKAFRDAEKPESKERLKHEAAIAEYERQIMKLEGAKTDA